MKIPVKHEVPYDAGHEAECRYDDADYFGQTTCAYHCYRNRTHGRKAPIEFKKPKCALFDTWLVTAHQKCPACLTACEQQAKEEERNA